MIARTTTHGLVLSVRQEADHTGATESEVNHDAKECIELLEGGGEVKQCQEAPNPIVPAVNELIWGGLAFFILLGLMAKFAFPAITKAMEARTNKIRDNLDEADRTRAEAHTILEDYQRQLADARNESSRIIEEARQTADQLRRDLMSRAEADVAELRQRNTEELISAQDRALADLRGQVATIAIDVAERVVQRNLDRDTNQALVESFIRDVTTSQAGASS
ncbi:MAG TPA: F0F1 ATP synthase subunit B [Acidimicrobiales bacterium]|nr:F0F1 ATP synthase subunit B [Acidimicrobiales bacterium]